MPYVFKKPEAQDEEYPERIRRKIQMGEKISAPYKLTDSDLRLIRFEQHKKAFSNTLVTFVAALRKIKFDVPNNPNKEWLVYKLIETVKDKEHQPHSVETWHGFHTEPVADVQRNQLDEVTGTVIENEVIVYDIPFSREAVQKVLDIPTRSNTPSNLAIGEGMAHGPEDADPIRGNPMSVFNLENFIQFKYDYLEGANKEGLLTSSYQGILNYFKAFGIDPNEALCEGETIPESYLADVQGMAPSPSIQAQEQNLSKAKYKQTESRQKAQQ